MDLRATMEGDLRPHAALFDAAADLLAEHASDPGTEAGAAACDLLQRLDYLDGDAATEDAATLAHRVALLRAAAGFERLFSLPAEHAPGLVALGAEVSPVALGVSVDGAPIAGVSGTGVTLRQAFESCVGEGIEYLSSFASPGDPIDRLTDEAALRQAPASVAALFRRLLPGRGPADAADWTWAADLRDGTLVRLPADLCYRRAAPCFPPPWPLSTGCGAGADLPMATLHGLLEVIERDATALWWRGGRRGRVVPPDLGGTMLASLRQGTDTRRSWLLDITTDAAVPVVAALSCNDDGFGLCAGFACRPTLAGAADAALREMAQMELAVQLSLAKRALRGEAALNEADRRHLDRYYGVPVAVTVVLHPLAPPAKTCNLNPNDTLGLLGAVRMRLETIGIEALALTLDRAALGVPAARVVCPGLEMGLAAPPGPRLLATASRTGVDPLAIPLL